MRCDNCRYWKNPLTHDGNDVELHPDDYAGECRRYPPRRDPDIQNPESVYWPADAYTFPMAAGHWWCGEYKTKDGDV